MRYLTSLLLAALFGWQVFPQILNIFLPEPVKFVQEVKLDAECKLRELQR